MEGISLAPVAAPVMDTALAPPGRPTNAKDAAQQFESLLLAQVLQSAHEEGKGWFGSEDSAASSATSFAEQQLAVVLARQGGLGLSKLIAAGLERHDSESPAPGGNTIPAP